MTTALPSTFTLHSHAKLPDSDALCQACVAIIDGNVFKSIIAERSFDIKLWAQCGWHNYSHFATGSGGYEVPKPARVREILLDPPDEPFVVAVNVSGQKHSLILARVAFSREAFPIHFADETFVVMRRNIAACVADFEAMSELGFQKEQTRTGLYHQESIRRAGLLAWRKGEERVGVWRRSDPRLLDLAAWCGRSTTWFSGQEAKI